MTIAQNEINLIADKPYTESNLILLNLKAIDGNKILAKYLSFPTAGVKSTDESTMNGRVLASNGIAINGHIAFSNIVMVLTEQEIDVNTKTITNLNHHLIAVRDVYESKSYQLFFEGFENKIPYLKAGQQVPFNKYNISKIPNITTEESAYLQKVLDGVHNSTNKNDFNRGMLASTKEVQGLKALLSDMQTLQQTFKLPTDNENTLKYEVLDEGVEYLITRDRRIKKDVGVAYKSYFVYNKRDLVKVDSVFFADKSDMERPEKVYDMNINKYNGVLMRLSCEPFISTKKENENYFRYTYFDKDKNIKRFRFQLENGKLNSFNPERTFKLGDTLIHLTTKKAGFLKVTYQSSVFKGDTVNLRYPLNSNDTIKFQTVYCGKGVGTGSFFGFEQKIFLNTKVGDTHFLVEQETVSKSETGLVKTDHPEANIKGFSLTKVYTINNNAVKKITKVAVPYFSDRTSKYSEIHKDSKSSIYMLQLAYPVFFVFKNTGELKVKDASIGGFYPISNSVNSNYTFDFNNNKYIIYHESNTGKMKLVPLEL